MGILSKFIRGGVKVASGLLGHALNTATGGWAGKIGSSVRDFAHTHSGIIGKALRGAGKAVLSDDTRNKLSKVADKALKYIPSGKTKDALTALNNSAQGKSVLNVSVPPTPIAKNITPKAYDTGEPRVSRPEPRNASVSESF